MLRYLRDNWDGWPLHGLVAAGLFYAFDWYGAGNLYLALNTAFWPNREADQHRLHGGWKAIWTLHRVIEWAVPVAVGAVLWIWRG